MKVWVCASAADRCIQNSYKQLRQETGRHGKYPGVLGSLLMLDKLSIEDIKASVTELMAGGVDTVTHTAQDEIQQFFFFTVGAQMAKWLGSRAIKQKVVGSIPGSAK